MNNDSTNILLIEDNPGDVRLIQEMLYNAEVMDFSLEVAGILEDGLALIREQQFDVILLDLTLPDSDSTDTLTKVLEEANTTAIVVLTGFDNQQFGVQAVKFGAQDYLVKDDTNGKLLVRALRYAIERHRSEEILRRSRAEYQSLIDDVFDTSAVAVLIMDRHFEVMWCNEATEVYFGISRERLLGRDKRDLINSELRCIFADPDDYAAHLLKAYEELTFTNRFECRVLPGPNRQERWLEHWSQPIRDGIYKDGRIEQYNDITDRKYYELAERQQRQFAEALRDTAAALTGSLDLDEVLDRILANIELVVPHKSAGIMLVEEGEAFTVRRKWQQEGEHFFTHDRIRLDEMPLLTQMMDTQQSITATDLTEHVQSYAGTPIQLQDEVIGFINVYHTEPDQYDEGDADCLAAFAEQAAIAIQNARLYARSQELAAVKERQRLARELHDSVSQTLFTCRALAEAATYQWNKNPKKARDLIDEVRQLSATALSEMRILLLELHPAALTQVSLKQLFEQYLEPVGRRQQFEITLEIEDIPDLPPDVQIALYRIGQEAVNNVVKHAQANHVTLRVNNNEPGQLELTIVDDGGGFDTETVSSTSLGLEIMRERAKAIGASVTIKSDPERGTCITAIWPKRKQGE